MRLHILGPAFGLPSIDPECTAAVALVKTYCEKEGKQWELVPSHETSTSDCLPLLEDGEVSIRGFGNIVKHLSGSKGSIPGWAASLSPEQEADQTAFSSFIESNGQLLLDVSLYVSFENYRLRTRPAFTKILPWYANYIWPPRYRAAAKARSEHLGVSTIDVDNVHDDLIDKPQNIDATAVGKKPGFEHETDKRARYLLGPRMTVRSMLRRPEHAAAFRLKALTDAFFEPLQDVLGDNEYLLATDSPSVLDCLAYGYLSLMLYPDMEQDWLAVALRKHYPRLAQYVERLRCHLDIDTDAAKVMSALNADNGEQSKQSIHLPWTPAERRAPTAVLSFIGLDLYRRLPLVGDQHSIHDTRTKGEETSTIRRYLPGLVGLASTALAVFGYWAYHNITWPHGEMVQVFGRRRLTDYGAAGAALAALGNQMQYEQAYQQDAHSSPVSVEVVEEP